jgi:hypothetical protein
MIIKGIISIINLMLNLIIMDNFDTFIYIIRINILYINIVIVIIKYIYCP